MKKLYYVFITFILISRISIAAPKADLWDIWLASDESNTSQISHQQWAVFLTKHIVMSDNGNRLVDYSSVSRQQREDLNTYIRQLESIDPRKLRRDEQFAYWVNLYNAATVALILENYPVKSITKLGGLFSFGPWDDELVTVAGYSLTLNDIEHRILRPIWKDKRIHYVVNCASIGCPNLQNSPFEAKTLEEQLERAASEFINSSKGVAFKGSNLILSEIYDWYQSDFGNDRLLKNHLIKYLNSDKAELLKSFDGKISYRYDWSLNDIK